MDLFGTEVVIDGMVGETRMLIKARAAICGSNALPDNMHPDAADGALIYLRAVQNNRNISGPKHLEKVLREEHHGVKIMAKKNPRDSRPPICWEPSQTKIEERS